MPTRNIIVGGPSAVGIEALLAFTRTLPQDFHGSILFFNTLLLTTGTISIKYWPCGIAVVQSPDALHDSLPKSALQRLEVDYLVKDSDLQNLLAQLTSEKIVPGPESKNEDRELLKKRGHDCGSAECFRNWNSEHGNAVVFYLPECHGAFVSIKEVKAIRNRCHTAHAFGSTALLAEATKTSEESFWNTLRGLEESCCLRRKARPGCCRR